MSPSVWTVGVGSSIDGILAQLEADLRSARERGAPDDAVVTPTGGPKSGSVYLAEVIWVG